MNTELKELIESGYSVPLRHNLADITGSPRRALVLTQMIYWAERATRPGGWFWKSAQDIANDLKALYSRRTIAKELDALVANGWLERKAGPDPMKRAYYYRVREAILLEALRSWKATWDAEQAEKVTGRKGQSIAESDQSIGEGCQYSREPKAQSTASENLPIPDGIGAPERKPQVKVSAEILKAAQRSVDTALMQSYQMVRNGLWHRVNFEINDGKRLDELFGANFILTWSNRELGYLTEMLSFCNERWPDRDAGRAVGVLIRGTFSHEGKAFQMLKYWIKHARKQPTLRPFLTLAGGGKDPKARFDILRELAANPKVQELIGQVGPKPVAASEGQP